MGFWNYKNPAWEPAFEHISPSLARLYFSTKFGPVKWFAADLMFKKLGKMEMRDARRAAKLKVEVKTAKMIEAYAFVNKLYAQFLLDEELFMEVSSAYDDSAFSFADTFPKAIVELAMKNGWKV